MTFFRQLETGSSGSLIVPEAFPLVTDGELDNTVFVESGEYKYSGDTLYQATDTSWVPSYSVVNGKTFVPDYNDEDLFEHVWTVPSGDISADIYSWRKSFQVTYDETTSDGGTPPEYTTTEVTADAAISFRTRLDGVKITPGDWGSQSKLYYSDTYTKSIMISPNDSVSPGDVINGNTVTNIVKGTLYYLLEFSGSNGFSEGVYGTVNVLCGYGIKNKFGVLGWFFTDFKKYKITPDFQKKLDIEFSNLIGNSNILNITDDEEETLYQSCYSEIGARKLKSAIEEIYKEAKLLNLNTTFDAFEETFISDGIVDNTKIVVGSGVKGQNFITLKEPVALDLLFRGEYAWSINIENLEIIGVSGNVLTLSGALPTTFTDKSLRLTKSAVLRRYRDLPASSNRVKYNISDFDSYSGENEDFLNRKNYNSLFESFGNNIGKFTLTYNWTLLDCKDPGLADVDSTETFINGIGSTWDYPSTDYNGKFYIEGLADQQYKLNVTPTFNGSYFTGATISGVYTSIPFTQLFGVNSYVNTNYTNDAGVTAVGGLYDFRSEFLIPFAFDIGAISERLGEYVTEGKLFNESSCLMTSPLTKTSTEIKVDNTTGFYNSGWILIPKYTVKEGRFNTYDFTEFEVIAYSSKTINTFRIFKRGAFGTPILDFPLPDLEDSEMESIPIVQFEGYGGING